MGLEPTFLSYFQVYFLYFCLIYPTHDPGYSYLFCWFPAARLVR